MWGGGVAPLDVINVFLFPDASKGIFTHCKIVGHHNATPETLRATKDTTQFFKNFVSMAMSPTNSFFLHRKFFLTIWKTILDIQY
jgi:hypothetical protein